MRSRPRVISGKTKDMAQEVRLNGVRYRWPKRPVVVVCIDGGDPAYFDRALKDAAQSGKLDAWLKKVDVDIDAGRTKPLDEVINDA